MDVESATKTGESVCESEGLIGKPLLMTGTLYLNDFKSFCSSVVGNC